MSEYINKINWKPAAVRFAMVLPALLTFALLIWTAPSVMWLFR